MTPIDILIPDGSLDQPTVDFFARAGIELELEDEGLERYRTNQPFIRWVFKRRPQEIPIYLARNFAHLGITGEDWWLESAIKSCFKIDSYHIRTWAPWGSIEHFGRDYNVVKLSQSLIRLPFSKQSSKPIKLSILVLNESPYQQVVDLPEGASIATEYPEITSIYCISRFNYSSPGGSDKLFDTALRQYCDKYILPSYGKTEQKLRDGLAEAAIDAVETGRTLEVNNLRVIETILESYPVILPNLQLTPSNGWSQFPAICRFLRQINEAVPKELTPLTRPRTLSELCLSISSSSHWLNSPPNRVLTS